MEQPTTSSLLLPKRNKSYGSKASIINNVSNLNAEDNSFDFRAQPIPSAEGNDVSFQKPVCYSPPESQHESLKDWQVYKRRFWVLIVFSLLLALQSCSSSVFLFSESFNVALRMFNTESRVLELLYYFGPILNVPFIFMASWLLNAEGLRTTVITGSVIGLIGAIVRCFATTEATFWLAILGHALNAVNGALLMVCPARLSFLWFSKKERTTSTATSSLAPLLGAPIAFVLNYCIFTESTTPVSSSGSGSVNLVSAEQKLLYIFYGEAGVAGLLTLLVVIYFPSQPPKPPSLSSFISRSYNPKSYTPATVALSVIDTLRQYGNTLRETISSQSIVLLLFAGGLSIGMYSAWSYLLISSIKPPYSLSSVGWIWGDLSGFVGGLVLALIADRYPQSLKFMVLILTLISGILFPSITTAGMLSATEVPIELDDWVLTSLSISSGVFLYSCLPLYYELMAEVTHPIAEGTSSGLLVFVRNAVFLVFVFGYVGRDTKSPVPNWIVTGGILFSLMLLLFLRPEYKRTQIDRSEGNFSL